MPRIRDGNNRVTEYDMGPPPAVPTGPATRVDVPGEIVRTAGMHATGLPRLSRPDSNPLTRPDSRARGSAAAAATKAASKREPKVPIATSAHHDAGTNRIRQQVEDGARAAAAATSTDDASEASIPVESVKPTGTQRAPIKHSDQSAELASTKGPRRLNALQLSQRSQPSALEQAAVDALRTHGTRRAAAAALGLANHVVLELRLGNLLKKGLLPADLPDLPPRLRPPGWVAAAIAEVATPPGPPDWPVAEIETAEVIELSPGLRALAAAEARSAPSEAGGGPVEGEDRCAFGRWLDGTVIFMCDRAADHGGDVHRGRLVRASFVSGTYGVIGHAVVPA